MIYAAMLAGFILWWFPTCIAAFSMSPLLRFIWWFLMALYLKTFFL